MTVSVKQLGGALATVLLLAGCGGESTSEAERVGTEFAGQAVEVCRAALADKQQWAPFPAENFDPRDPDPSQFTEVSGWLADEVAPTFEGWLADLDALGTPPTGQEAWDNVLTAVNEIVELNAAQVQAAREDDTDAFAVATDDLNSTQDKLVAATEEAGVAECADVHA